jgi:hypothetical protein
MSRGEGRRAPLATVRFVEERPLRIEFEFASRDYVEPVVIKDDQAIRHAWERAGKALNELVDFLDQLGETTGDRPLDPEDLWDPFRCLLRAGRQLGQRLTADDAARFNTIQAAFRKSRAGWVPFRPDDIPAVHVFGDDVSFPLEMLPVFLERDDSELPALENTRDVMRIGEAFLGFSAVVRRLPYGTEPEAAVLANDPKLPIQFVRYRGPPRRRFSRHETSGQGFAAEAQFIQSLDLLSVDGPWPTADVCDADVVRGLVDALFDPRRRLVPAQEGGAEVAAAIAHFACHCETEDRDSEDFELIFSTPDGERRSVTFGDIQDGYGQRGEQLAHASGISPARAPVILNACGSSVIDPWSAQSLHRWFLRNGHPAYVGTQAAVPDGFAAQVAEWIYRFLLGGFSLGEALLLARRKTLLTGWGPLGLLYVMHGNDRLDVAVKHPELLPDLYDDQPERRPMRTMTPSAK